MLVCFKEHVSFPKPDDFSELPHKCLVYGWLVLLLWRRSAVQIPKTGNN